MYSKRLSPSTRLNKEAFHGALVPQGRLAEIGPSWMNLWDGAGKGIRVMTMKTPDSCIDRHPNVRQCSG